MSTPSLADQARLAELLPVAIAEGWDVPKLAKAARVGKHAANVALRERVGQIVALSEGQGAGLLQLMQREAAIERPAVVARLKAAGSAADLLLVKAGEMIEALEAGGDDESGRLESRLASLASVVKAAAAASRESWLAFKDASGLAFAEDQARAALKTSGKERPALVPDVVFELLPEGERE